MKKKTGVYFSALALCCTLLSGCAKTPEQTVVREKGSQNIENYKEATESSQTQEAGTSAEADGAENTRTTEGAAAEGTTVTDGAAAESNPSGAVAGEPSAAAGQNALAQRLQVPERYEASGVSVDENFRLTCSAEVEVPDVDRIGVYRVGRLPFDQDFIDQVSAAFFGDAVIYESSYFDYTKEQALAHLNELKAYQAERNMDPYGMIASLQQGREIPTLIRRKLAVTPGGYRLGADL